MRVMHLLIVAALVAGCVLGISAGPLAGQIDSAALIARADRLYSQAKYSEALSIYQAAEGAATPELVEQARTGTVHAALRIARFELADRASARLVRDRPGDVHALAVRGDALWANGLFDEADEVFRRAEAIDATSPRVQLGLGRSLESRGRFREAVDVLQMAEAQAPGDFDICVQLADAWERMFRYEPAAETLDRCIPLIPSAIRKDADIPRAKLRLLKGFKGRSPAATDGGVYTVPFKLVDDKIVLAARLNGRSLDIVLDTGADKTTVTHETAAGSRLKIISETWVTGVGPVTLQQVSVGRADTLQIGPLTVRDLPVVVRDINLPPSLHGKGDSFSPQAAGLSVLVDYRRREVTLGRNLPSREADVTMPLRTLRLPMVRAVVNDRQPASFIVDTGGQMVSLSSETAARLEIPPAPRIQLEVWGTTGRDFGAFLLPGVGLAFQNLDYPRRSLAVLNLRAPSVLLGFQIGGILGHAFLREYTVAMDFARGELRLQHPN